MRAKSLVFATTLVVALISIGSSADAQLCGVGVALATSTGSGSHDGTLNFNSMKPDLANVPNVGSGVVEVDPRCYETEPSMIYADDAPPAAPADDDEGGRFHFDIGISYVNGVQKLNSALSDDVTAAGGSYSSTSIPVGIQLDPYYLFNFGLGIGGCVGPTEVIYVDNSDFGPGLSSPDVSAVIPVGADVRYEFLNNSGMVPFGRVGFRYPITLGDSVSNGNVGFFAGGGVEFTQIHIGLEVSYDSSTVQVNYGGFSEKATASGLMVTFIFHL